MKLHLLGTGGYHPSDRRHTACLMLPEVGVVLDAGTAMFRVRDLLVTPTLDIFLTHAHLDHSVGLTYLFDVLWQRDVQQVVVHATADKLAAIEQHLLAEAIFPVRPPCELRPLATNVTVAGGGRLTHFPLAHPGGVVGYRLDWPSRSLAYVTDTTAAVDASYLEAIRGVDLLVHECYFPDAMRQWAERTGHSCTSDVARLAAAAKVGRAVLVHVNPLAESDEELGVEQAKQTFAHIELASDGDVVEF
jgi:ribonuclease BN (tRNA processing enzyme)